MDLDRDELDQVIRRAVELQMSAGERDEGEHLSEEEVVRIGREVGLEPRHVRRALGELRAEALLPPAPAERGAAARLLGPAHLRASRAVSGSPERVLERLEEYLRVGESLRPVRKRGPSSRWEAEPGFIAQIQRGLSWGGRSYDLARARFVEIAAQPLEEGYSLVLLEADASSIRNEHGWGWGAGLGASGLGLGLGVGMAVGLPVLSVPGVVLGLSGGVALGRHTYRKQVEKIRLSMEGILDRLEAGEPLLTSGPSLRDRLGARRR